MRQQNICFVFGKPAAGVTSVAKELERATRALNIDVDDIYRSAVRQPPQNSPAILVDAYKELRNTRMLSNRVLDSMIINHLRRATEERIIVAGAPIDPDQARRLTQFIRNHMRANVIAVRCEVPDELARERSMRVRPKHVAGWLEFWRGKRHDALLPKARQLIGKTVTFLEDRDYPVITVSTDAEPEAVCARVLQEFRTTRPSTIRSSREESVPIGFGFVAA